MIEEPYNLKTLILLVREFFQKGRCIRYLYCKTSVFFQSKRKVITRVVPGNFKCHIYDLAVDINGNRRTSKAISLHDAMSREKFYYMSKNLGAPPPTDTTARAFFGFTNELSQSTMKDEGFAPSNGTLKKSNTEHFIQLEKSHAKARAIFFKLKREKTEGGQKSHYIDYCFAGISGEETLSATTFFEKNIRMIGRLYGTKDFFIGLKTSTDENCSIVAMSKSESFWRHHLWGRYYNSNYKIDGIVWPRNIELHLPQTLGTLQIPANDYPSGPSTPGGPVTPIPTPFPTQSINAIADSHGTQSAAD